MRPRHVLAVILWCVTVGLVQSSVAQDVLSLTVVKVIDGDTVKVLLNGGEKSLRLIGVNSEETNAIAPCGRAWAKEATVALTSLVSSGPLRIAQDVDPDDPYGRLLVYLWVGEIFVNETLLRQGLARYSNPSPNNTYRDLFKAAEAQAQQEGAGMWGE